jgi:uncharacterized protein with beta-barrel porin domain
MIDASRGRRARLGWWLASTSLAAVLVGGGAPPAFAACVSVNATFDNPSAQTVPGVCVTNTSFTGNITNEGTISPLGIVFTNGTITGFIASTGAISGGISLDSQSRISASGTAISISGDFAGNISNGGAISSAAATGIRVDGVSTFAGGITNSGSISAHLGMRVTGLGTETFQGGIVNLNGGTISGSEGILVISIGQFGSATAGGGIVNAGAILSDQTAVHVDGVSLFAGGISNAGTISSSSGIGVNVRVTSTFLGGITNTGLITGASAAINVESVSSFAGGITNSSTGRLTQSVTLVSSSATNIFAGIQVFNGSTFSGGVSNAGVISASVNISGGGGATAYGIFISGVSNFAGGISNSGTISAMAASTAAFARSTGIRVDGVSTFAGGITNSGSISAHLDIRVTGLGTETFQGGIVNLSGGTLSGSEGILVISIGQFGSASAGGGIFNAGAILSTDQTAVHVDLVSLFAGGISNAGTISTPGDGLNVRNISTFLGGITNTGRITGGSNAINVESVSSFAGNISNAGTLTATTAIAIGAGVTFAAGGAIVNTGTIAGSFAAIDLTAATMPVTIDQQAGLISGAILLSSNADVVNVSGGSIAGSILGHGTADTINFALGSGTFTYGAAYSFSGINQVNVTSGTVILDGANSATNVAVTGGNLEVGDAGNAGATLTGTLNVTSAGTLSGHGTVVGAVTINGGGTLAPGGSIGTITVTNGPLTFNAGSTYAVQINDTTSSKTLVTGAPGTLVINGGTVVVTPAFTSLGAHASMTYTIANSTGLRTGTFAGLTVNSGFTGTMSLSYDAHDVFLNTSTGFTLLSPPSGPGIPPSNLTINQQNVLNGINNAILAGDTIPAGFQGLASLSGPALLKALTLLSGENNAGFFQGAFQAGNGFLNLMVNPFLDGRFGNDGGFGPATGFAAEDRPALPQAAAAFASAMPVKAAADTFDRRFSVWGSAFGGSGTVNGDPIVGSHTTTSQAYGFAAGVDYRLASDTTVGFALVGGGTNWSLDAGLGGGRSDMFQAGVYGSHRWGAAYLSGAASYNFHDVTTNRTVTIAGTDMLTAGFRANGVGARIESGYRVATPIVGITPYAAGQVQSIFLPNYGETASSGSAQFALNFASQTATATRSELGSWLDKSVLLDNGALLTFYGRAAWAHDFGNGPNASALFQALPGSNFVVNGATPARDRALATAGAQWKFISGWSLQAKFDGEFSNTTSIYSGTGMVRKVW